jgi:hypothetical protein
MTPLRFKESNVTFAEDQPQYQPLPAFRADDGTVVSCWRLTFWERLRVLFGSPLWLFQLTFGEPLQPQLPQIERPKFQVEQ